MNERLQIEQAYFISGSTCIEIRLFQHCTRELEFKTWLAVLAEQDMSSILCYVCLFYRPVMYCPAYHIREFPQLIEKANTSGFFLNVSLSSSISSPIKLGNK